MQIKKEDKRERIMKAAARLFAERGFQEVSVTDIAKDAGVGKGTIYTYFNEKTEILEACVRGVFDSFVEKAKLSLEKSNNFSKFLDNLAEDFLDNVDVNSKLFFLFHRKSTHARKNYEKLTAEYKRVIKEVYDKYSKEMNRPFEVMYALFTVFLMTSYMVHESVPDSTLKEVLKTGLECSIKGKLK